MKAFYGVRGYGKTYFENRKKESSKSKLEKLILLYAIMVNDERIPEEIRKEYANKYLEVVE